MVREGAETYVFAWNAAKERVATFALSRFRHIEATGARFAPPTDFDPKAYARNAFGIAGGEKPIKVRLLVEPKLAVYITEHQWHPSQAFHMRRDGRMLMRFETTGRKQVIRWVLSWMPDVKVLVPKSLRDRVSEKLGWPYPHGPTVNSVPRRSPAATWTARGRSARTGTS